MKRLLIATAFLAALTGAIWWTERQDAAKSGEVDPKAPPKVLAFKADDVTSLEVVLKSQPATVAVKDRTGKWALTAPTALPGDQAAIDSLVSSLATLTADRVVDSNLTDPASYGLDPANVSVQAKLKEGKVIHLRVGEKTPDSTGLYASVDGDKRLFALPAFSKDTFEKRAGDLRDKHLLSIESADKVSRVELNVTGKSAIEFTRVNDSQWRISKPRPMRADTLQVDELVRLMKDAEMDTSVDDKAAGAAFAASVPLATVRVTQPGGIQALEVRQSGADVFARSAVGTFKATPNLGPGVQKSVEAFQNKKLFDFGFDDPTKITYKSKDEDQTFEKVGMEWVLNGRPMDSVSVQNMIDKLRELAASSVADGAVGKPEIEMGVVSNKGKRSEKILIAPSGSDFVAQREKEPGVYRIPEASMTELRNAISGVQPAADAPKSDNKK